MVIELEKSFEKIKDHVLKTIHHYVEKYQLEISETTDYNLAIHLALSITREMSGNYIEVSQSQLEQCRNLETFTIAKELLQELSQYYDIKMPTTDVYYAAMYLANQSLLDLDFDVEYDIIDNDIENIMNETLDTIKEQLGYDLKSNEDFYKGMSLHFYPAIERLETDTQLDYNPMVKEISQFELSAQCAQILNNIVQKYYHKVFNENELSYITLHFNTAFYN